jgi:hypothetical protein
LNETFNEPFKKFQKKLDEIFLNEAQNTLKKLNEPLNKNIFLATRAPQKNVNSIAN